MPLKDNLVINKELRKLQKKLTKDMILSERLDMAYDIYKRCNKLLLEKNPADILNQEERDKILDLKKMVLSLLKKILNTASKKTIDNLMQDRIAKRKLDPAYIPLKKPTKLTTLPDPHTSTTKSQFHWRKIAESALAQKREKIMAVNQHSREKDIEYKIKKLTPIERDAHRVIINKGVFEHLQGNNNPNICNTKAYTSHDKKGYAAYVINRNGEISLFNHNNSADRICHSSLNASEPTLAAGEIKIVEGKLQEITDHSGHYAPTAKNIYETLQYFEQQGVDISNVKIHLCEAIDDLKIPFTPSEFGGHVFYTYQANDFCELFKKIEDNRLSKTMIGKLVSPHKSELMHQIIQLKPENLPIIPTYRLSSNRLYRSLTNLFNKTHIINPEKTGSAKKILTLRQSFINMLPEYKNYLLHHIDYVQSNLEKVEKIFGKILFNSKTTFQKSLSMLENIAINIQDPQETISEFKKIRHLLQRESTLINLAIKSDILQELNDALQDLSQKQRGQNKSFFSRKDTPEDVAIDKMVASLQSYKTAIDKINPAELTVIRELIQYKQTLDKTVAQFNSEKMMLSKQPSDSSRKKSNKVADSSPTSSPTKK